MAVAATALPFPASAAAPWAWVNGVPVEYAGQLIEQGTLAGDGTCAFPSGTPEIRLESAGAVTVGTGDDCALTIASVDPRSLADVAKARFGDLPPLPGGGHRDKVDSAHPVAMIRPYDLLAPESAVDYHGLLITKVLYGAPLPDNATGVTRVGNVLYQDRLEISYRRGPDGRMTDVRGHRAGSYCEAYGYGVVPGTGGEVDSCWYTLPFTGPDYVRADSGGFYRTLDATGHTTDERAIQSTWTIDRLSEQPMGRCDAGTLSPGLYLDCRYYADPWPDTEL